MAIKIRREDALNYHTQDRPGKIEVVPTKPLSSQLDLALAYSPGVAEPCKEIHADKEANISFVFNDKDLHHNHLSLKIQPVKSCVLSSM